VRLAPSLLPTIRTAYAKASMALRLPMSGGFEAFGNVRDIPFVARHASLPREEVCRRLKLPADKPIVLSSFGGYGLPSFETDTLSKTKKYTIVTAVNIPLSRARHEAVIAERKGAFIGINEEAMYDAGVRYEDLVAASEAVVTKPGYGIISECIANDTAILYTSRGHFPEYDVLVEEMPKYLRSAFISQDDLLAGKWDSHLDKLRAQPKPKKKPETDGADVAAEILLKALDKPPRKPRGRPRARA
jgi:L-arabinokinase